MTCSYTQKFTDKFPFQISKRYDPKENSKIWFHSRDLEVNFQGFSLKYIKKYYKFDLIIILTLTFRSFHIKEGGGAILWNLAPWAFNGWDKYTVFLTLVDK